MNRFYNREETQRHLKICIEIERHLIEKYKLLPKREWFLILDHEDHIIGLPRYEITVAEKARKERYRNPDLLWWDNGLVILEVDGYVHYVKSANTEKRNKIYKNNNCKFMVIETFELNEKGKVVDKPIENIIKELESKIDGDK
jgi:hypothetical protein